jgi:iron uptake system EfeUOB component EfeO/EfeM
MLAAMKLVPRRALLGAALVFAVAGCTHHTPHRDTGEITVTRGNCGPAWHVPGGTATFQIRNAGTVTTDVELVDPTSGGIYAEVDALAPGTSRPMRVLLGRGQYAFRCLGDETDSVTGPVVRVADGPAHGAPAIQPVTEQDLAGAVRQYRSYVSTGLGRLDANVAALRRAVHAGDLAGARAAWLTAHLAYERLGAAYGTFGDFADAIDGRPDGLPGGVRDPGFTGFHRIEYGLWHAESAAALSRSVDRLATDVAALRKNFSKEQTDPHDLPLGAH